jgi:predicted nucleic acid-binding protein
MRLVIDSNRLMAGLIKHSICRKIILHKDFAFYSPDAVVIEIGRHRDYLIEKSKTDEKNFDVLLYTLLENITVIPYEDMQDEFEIALKEMKSIDVKDSPFLAVGIAVKADGIWTEDRDFLKQNILKVYSTKELLDMIR